MEPGSLKAMGIKKSKPQCPTVRRQRGVIIEVSGESVGQPDLQRCEDS